MRLRFLLSVLITVTLFASTAIAAEVCCGGRRDKKPRNATPAPALDDVPPAVPLITPPLRPVTKLPRESPRLNIPITNQSPQPFNFVVDAAGHKAVARILVKEHGARDDTGSTATASLIGKRQLLDGVWVGVAITAAHTFEGVTHPVTVVKFIDQRPRAARLLALDPNNDLAFISMIVDKDAETLTLASTFRKGHRQLPVSICGYGSDGKYLCHVGALRGYATLSHDGLATASARSVPAEAAHKYQSSGQNQMVVDSDRRRLGDSGGPMFNDKGEVVAVFWGGGGEYSYGTISSTVVKEAQKRLPETYQWVADKRYRKPRRNKGTCTGCDAGCDECRTNDNPMVPLPPEVDPPATRPDRPRDGAAHAAIFAKLDELLSGQQAESGKILAAIDALPTADDQASIAAALSALLEGQQQNAAALVTLQESADTPPTGEVTLRVKSDRFISPSYVDVSTIWALQQKYEVDHMILIESTSSERWSHMEGHFSQAREVFPAVDLFDVDASGYTFTQLPQLVVYPLGDGEPQIYHGTDAVEKRLQKIYRGE